MGFKMELVTVGHFLASEIHVRLALTLQGSLRKQSEAISVVMRYRLASKTCLKFLPTAVLSDPQQLAGMDN